MNHSSDAESVERALEEALNRHGYGFQYSVIQAIAEVRQQRRTDWLFEVAEFPFSAGHQDGRIDFILRRLEPRWFMVAECKRVNPALADWCFARAPYVGRGSAATKILLESIFIPKDGIPPPRAAVREVWQSERVYHIALEIRSRVKGDEGEDGRGAIERAVGQVLRGVSGLAKWAVARPKFFEPIRGCVFLPVVFTSARLWTTEVDLSSGDLKTGNVAIPDRAMKEANWLWLNYGASPGLGHSLARTSDAAEIAESLTADYLRSVAIVNPSGLEAFLGDQPWFH